VHFLWNERHANFFLRQIYRKTREVRVVRESSSVASLVSTARLRKITATPKQNRQELVTSAVHRFEELIAGRAYLIEVTAVAKDRWRAYIVRVPGVPTALMPFYGRTPSEAAGLLSEWLARAHARAALPPN
jgi:hypothetical protein